MIKYSLVVPCYNEAENIDPLVSKCLTILERKDCEVILVDNGSYDQTKEKIIINSKKYNNLKLAIVERNQGFGYGVFTGINNSTGSVVGYCHADLQTDPKDFLKAIDIIETNNIANQNFLIKGRRLNRPLIDNCFTFFMSLYSSILFTRLLFDINSQPNVFNKNLINKLKFIPNDFNIDLYIFFIAKKINSKIFKCDVYFPSRERGEGSNDQLMQKIKNSLKQIINILLMRFKIFFY